jgi:fatty acid-binding protein DegV
MENPHVLQVEHTDLVKLGTRQFEQLIAASKTNIQTVNRQIDRFERALKRLKSKGKKDVISVMLRQHMGRLNGIIDNNQREIVINNKAIEILKDYEFETDKAQGNSASAYYGQTYR